MKPPIRPLRSSTPDDVGRDSATGSVHRTPRRSSFARRLQASYLTATAIALAVLLIPLGWVFVGYEYDDLAANAIVAGEAFSDVAGGPLSRGDVAELQRLATIYANSIGGTLAVFDASGDLVAEAKQIAEHSTDLADHPDIIAALRGERVSRPSSYEQLPGSISVATPVIAAGEVVGAIDIIMPTAAVEARIKMVLGALAVFSLAVLGTVAALGTGLTHWILRPLRELERSARSWAEGDTAARARIDSGPAELQELGDTFDLMAEYLTGLLEAHRTALAEACHELRLPLTAYRLRLANLEPFVAAEAQHRLDELDGDLMIFQRRLDRLVGLAWDTPNDTRQPVDVQRAVVARHAFWESTAQQRGVRLVMDTCAFADPNLLACEVSGALEEILDNLIANALAASPSGSTVSLSVVPVRDSIDVHVVDQGPGMSPASRQQAMETFLRKTRAGATGGGLGLAIVQQLATAMEGAIELRAAETGGLDAVVRLRPIADDYRSGARCARSSSCRAYGCVRLEPAQLGGDWSKFAGSPGVTDPGPAKDRPSARAPS